MKDWNFTIVDVETTGLNPQSDRIVEIAALVIEKGKLLRTFSTLVNPERPIPPFIEQLTGIRDQQVRNAPTFSEIAEEVAGLFRRGCLVAHNARFDYGFIRNELKNAGRHFSVKPLCTVRLSRALFPRAKGHSLDKIMKRMGLACRTRHRALDDADLLWQFLQKLSLKFSHKKIQEAFLCMTKTPTYPSGLKSSVVDSLPNGPGVYIFYNKLGAPLYVGKSIRIRDRVLSHFSSDYTRGKELALCRQTADLEAFPTAGELGALLLESRLIKKLQPWFNRRSRESLRLVVLRKCLSRKGYLTLKIEHLETFQPWDLHEIQGVFRSMRQAKEFLLFQIERQQLCPRLLGLEKGRGKCFRAQLKKCRGACAGKEAVCTYNQRFLETFRQSRIEPWPYSGPILIEEKNPLQGEGEAFLVDQWCLIGKLQYDGLTQNDLEACDFVFDFEVYLILRRFLKKPKNRKKIRRFRGRPEIQSEQIGFRRKEEKKMINLSFQQ